MKVITLFGKHVLQEEQDLSSFPDNTINTPSPNTPLIKGNTYKDLKRTFK